MGWDPFAIFRKYVSFSERGKERRILMVRPLMSHHSTIARGFVVPGFGKNKIISRGK